MIYAVEYAPPVRLSKRNKEMLQVIALLEAKKKPTTIENIEGLATMVHVGMSSYAVRHCTVELRKKRLVALEKRRGQRAGEIVMTSLGRQALREEEAK